MGAQADLTFEWRGSFTNDEANRLHAEAFDTRVHDGDLGRFYLDACGFQPILAGLMELQA